MEGRRFLRGKDREALREQWLLRAGQAFERMFAETHQEQLITFTQREDLACLLGKELAAFLLEQHAAADRQVRPPEQQPPGCPKCQQPGVRVTPDDGPLPERGLTTRAGEITLRRQQWRCPKCRVVFFSAGPQAQARDGALQPAALGEERASGQQGRFLQGSQ